MTWGIENTAVIGILLAVMTFFIRKWISGLEKKIEQVCAGLAGKVDDKTCGERRQVIADDIADLSKAKEASHTQIWDRIHHHKHEQVSGQVVISS